MRALLSTNHLFTWSGSEILVLELCESLRRRGWEVVVHANHWGPRLQTPIVESGATVAEAASKLRVFDFDFVWFQHHTATFFDYSLDRRSKAETRIVFAHLSPFIPLEYPGFVIESAIADLVISNSEETQAGITDARLVSTPRYIFPNPAPQSFFDHAKVEWQTSLRRLCVVSSHVPPEVRSALPLLEERHGIEHVTYGTDRGRHERLAPRDLVGFDAVVTIGKTVQYALASRTPVYCYDHFGGPGYLNPDNLISAGRRNFSGRCCARRLDAESIAGEIVTGYAAACTFSAGFCADDYRLDRHLDNILATGVTPNAEKARRLGIVAHDVERERRMAIAVVEGYCNALRTQHEVAEVRDQLARCTRAMDDLVQDRARAQAELKAHVADLVQDRARALAELKTHVAEVALRLDHIAQRPQRMRVLLLARISKPMTWVRKLVRI